MKKNSKASSGYVFCRDEIERHYMIKSISKEMPELAVSEIEEAIYTCCRDIKSKDITAAKHYQILECLRGKLSL